MQSFLLLLHKDLYHGYFIWKYLEIKNQDKATLLEKEDETRDLKANMERLFGIIRKYRGESFSFKKHISKLRGEAIGLLEEEGILKWEASAIKIEAKWWGFNMLP